MKTFSILGQEINDTVKPYVIAEMSGNHNQSFEQAISIIRAASRSGVNALKLQTYTPETITLNCQSDDFKISNSQSPWNNRYLYDLYSDAYTDWDWIKGIMLECKKHSITCFTSVFDETAIDFMENLNTPAYKIASFENNHIPLIIKASETGKPLIISTGTASEEDIVEAVDAARGAGCTQLALLKCTSDYPADVADSNLLTISYLKEKFDCEVGLSDHTLGIGVAIASVALGASIIEKHFIGDRSLGGVDASFSADESEMKLLVSETERAQRAIGKVNFALSNREENNIQFRRSIYASANIKKGDIFTSKNIKVIRPGFGLHPRYYHEIIGRASLRDFSFGQPIIID